MDVKKALKKSREATPQTPVEIVRGMTVRRTKGGIPVIKLHYSADPERDPNLNPAWKKTQRALYTSQADWDREQEIMDDAGGGELVFASVLRDHWDKIVITDMRYKPHPTWRCEAGFDHGKTNPTAFERAYVDNDGVIIFCGEYYMPGLEVWQHVPHLKKMDDIRKVSACYADPSIFPDTMQQSQTPNKVQERAKSINELYCEQGIELFSPFSGDRMDVSFAARVMMHWSNLEHREPTLKIVCRNWSEKPQPGLHNWDCPNLLWEMMRTRRVKLTNQQLLTRNVAEAIVDKDNHARDAAKYLTMSHPEPTIKTMQQIAKEAVAEMAAQGDLTSSLIRYNQTLARVKTQTQPARMGRRR